MRSLLAAIALVGSIVGGCHFPGTNVTGYTLTADGNNAISVAQSGSTVTLTGVGGDSTGSNYRGAYWLDGAPSVANPTECMTWASQTGTDNRSQEGIVLRARQVADKSLRLITVTKNVIYGITWVVNVHVWDTSLPTPFIAVGQFDMSAVVGNGSTLPWNICARAIGNTVSFKIWLPGHPVPAWGNAIASRSVHIPTDYTLPGISGWFGGHITTGNSITYTNTVSN